MRFFDCITEFIFVENEPERADIIFVPGGNYPDAAVHAARLYREGLAPYVLPSGRYSIVKGYFEVQDKGPGVGNGHFEMRDQSSGIMNESFEVRDQKSGIGNEHFEAQDQSSGIMNGHFEAQDQNSGVGNGCQEGGDETEWAYLRSVLLENGVPAHAVLREDQATYTYENAIYSRRLTDRLGIEVKKAILCCQAFHARRCLMYYQEQFPDTEFLVCPVVTRGIAADTWHCTPEGIETVLGEMERCGAQFHEIMKQYMDARETPQCWRST